MKEIAKLNSLTYLDLTGCKEITNDGLKEIAKLKSLTHLDLSYCPKVTDDGLEEVFARNNIYRH